MLELKNITKKYGDKTVYENFSLNIESGKTLAILGNSGSGKTTLLKIMASLTDFTGEVVGFEKPSFIFAEDRLLPHKTVKENLLFVNQNKCVDAMLERVNLKEYENAYPNALSTGMARRVSVLRGFCFDSNIILMDEPFRNLDLKLKYSLMDFYLELNRTEKRTAVFVTHDPDEAVYIANKVIVIDGGKVVYEEDIIDKEKSLKNLKEKLING